MKRKLNILILGIICTIFLVNIYYVLYYKYKIVIPCLFHEITGLYCPGCGITRMIFSLFKLDLYQAFRYNSFVFFLLPFIIFYFVDTIIKWLKGQKNYLYLKINDKEWIILLVIALLFGILRNLPYFKFLIPTIIK